MAASTSQVYHSLICREVIVDHGTGTVSYCQSNPLRGNVPVAQFVAARPLTPQCSRFSLKIVNCGQRGCIAIGLCHKDYPPGRQPGWNQKSIAYHADDGGIFWEDGFPCISTEESTNGDELSCELSFQNRTVSFSKNGEVLYVSRPLNIPPGGFYPAVGLHSLNESIQLLETEPWQLTCQQVSQVYNWLHCRNTFINDDKGLVSYNSQSSDCPVAQFIAAKPFTRECCQFSIEIVKPGRHRCIAIGLCDRNYPDNNQPGWKPLSIAYHADDGGIFHEHGHALTHVAKAKVGDVMSCRLDLDSRSVTFFKNHNQVYKSSALRMPLGGFHPAVGLHSVGETVRLLERQPWESAGNQQIPEIYKSLFCREAVVYHDTGIVSYCSSSPDIPVAQFIAPKPLSREYNRFSIELINVGQRRCIAVGLCHKNYCPRRQPGWEAMSVGYHADDGGIFLASGHAVAHVGQVMTGDTMTCKLNFDDQTVIFFRNERQVYRSETLRIPPDGFYPVIGLHSLGEAVRLLETEPWRLPKTDEAVKKPTSAGNSVPSSSDHPTGANTEVENKPTMPACAICLDHGVERFLIPCGHTFCGMCADEWAKRESLCPTCRTYFTDIKRLFF